MDLQFVDIFVSVLAYVAVAMVLEAILEAYSSERCKKNNKVASFEYKSKKRHIKISYRSK